MSLRARHRGAPLAAERIRMRVSRPVLGLSLLIVVLSVVATLVPMCWTGDRIARSILTTRAQAVALGSGFYRHDSLFIAAGFRGQDLITLGTGAPLLLLATIRCWKRASPRRVLLLVAILAYFLYVYASMAFGAAYNELFLVYVALFSASLFALAGAWRAAAAAGLSATAGTLPRRGPGVLMLASGAVTLAVWLIPILSALAKGEPPALLDHYTTMVTYALDLGIVTPLALASGVLILRGNPAGYRLAIPLLGIIVMLAPTIIASTIFQHVAGVVFSAPAIVGPIAGFVAMGGFAIWAVVAILRRVSGNDAVPTV